MPLPVKYTSQLVCKNTHYSLDSWRMKPKNTELFSNTKLMGIFSATKFDIDPFERGLEVFVAPIPKILEKTQNNIPYTHSAPNTWCGSRLQDFRSSRTVMNLAQVVTLIRLQVCTNVSPNKPTRIELFTKLVCTSQVQIKNGSRKLQVVHVNEDQIWEENYILQTPRKMNEKFSPSFGHNSSTRNRTIKFLLIIERGAMNSKISKNKTKTNRR